MILIGLAGQKQSGKSTGARYIRRKCDCPCIIEHAFADSLKEFCIKVLGLTRLQCGYDGADDNDKNSLTEYKWENVDPFFRNKYSKQGVEKTGFMTAREVMQVQGEMQRSMFCRTLWIDCIFRKIAQTSDECLHIITDIRHRNEVERVVAAGGYVIHLMKRTNNDKADSEAELLQIPWDEYPNIFHLDNSDLTIRQKNSKIKEILRIIPHLKLKEKNNETKG